MLAHPAAHRGVSGRLKRHELRDSGRRKKVPTFMESAVVHQIGSPTQLKLANTSMRCFQGEAQVQAIIDNENSL
jgi:hypothetical protein